MSDLRTIALAAGYVALPLAILALQTTRVDGYVVTRAIGSTSIALPDNTVVLMDYNNDKVVDLKYGSCTTRRGSCSYYLLITSADQQTFDDISSKL